MTINRNRKHTYLFCAFMIMILRLYLCVFFAEGIWYGNTFLYQKSEGLFTGTDLQNKYVLQMAPTHTGMAFSFTVNKKTEQYQIVHNPEPPRLQVYRDNTVVFEGTASHGDQWHLTPSGSSAFIDLGIDGVVYKDKNAFPTYTQLLNWSFLEKISIRGNVTVLYIIIPLVIVFFLLTCFPTALYTLFRRLPEYIPEEKQFYHALQKKVRWGAFAVILLFMLLGLMLHKT